MFIMQLGVLVMTCAVHSCLVKKYKESEAKTESMSRKSRKNSRVQEESMADTTNMAELRAKESDEKLKSKFLLSAYLLPLTIAITTSATALADFILLLVISYCCKFFFPAAGVQQPLLLLFPILYKLLSAYLLPLTVAITTSATAFADFILSWLILYCRKFFFPAAALPQFPACCQY
ncbi:hypothetical protein NE237_000041 [Protea cynaroides]|uniref:Uncharacterized protein n=1 Tax=Protea cynaroides TaxID=273540 RepID=A0A9Q0GP35_9MAGN|nr:hypothetical protein NE237_000041 [Protea cynaroides]